MTKLNTLLLVILLGSSLYLVKTAYESRNLFVQLDRARNEERTLDIAYGRLELDKRAEATPLRVEKLRARSWACAPSRPPSRST